MTIQELYDGCGHSNKSIMLYFRKEEYVNLLKSETSMLPDGISNSERFYCWLHKITEIPACPFCGKPRRWKDMKSGYFATCGDKACKSAGIAKGNREAVRDWDTIQKKMRQTYKERTGYEHNMQNPEFKKKFFEDYTKAHNGESCGVQSKKAIENRKKTFDEKYNGSYRAAFEAGMIKKYGSVEECIKANSNNIKLATATKSENDLEELKRRLDVMGFLFNGIKDENIIYLRCKKCLTIFEIPRARVNRRYNSNNYNFCPFCGSTERKYRSDLEQEVCDELYTFYNYAILTNIKYMFNGLECDIVLPDVKIGIEVNGVYWHTEEYKDDNIHYTKKQTVENHGYQLIQIWDDDWIIADKRRIIISRIKNKLGLSKKIFARKCSVKNINKLTAKEFFIENHLNGYVESIYNIGLFYNDELVEAMCIDNSNGILVLNRFCTKQNMNVVGGLSKMISFFKKNHKDETMITYADCDWTNTKDSCYEKVGFRVKNPHIQYYWWANHNKRHTIKELKEKKSNTIKFNELNNTSEIETMTKYGYKRCFGSGFIIYEMTL